MPRNHMHRILLSAFAIVVALIASRPSAAQDAKQPYPTMAPVDLTDRDAEIALARSAAPDAISYDASVIVLTRHGYETAVQGKNGWVCWVGRGWTAMFDNPEFWSPKVRAADCLNLPAASIQSCWAKESASLQRELRHTHSSPPARKRCPQASLSKPIRPLGL